MTSDNLGIFLTHVTTFHNLSMTLMTHGDDVWWPWRPMVKTLWWPQWLVVKTLWQPLLWLLTTPHEITEGSCDDIDDLEQMGQIYRKAYGGGPYQVTTRTTSWWQWWLTTLSDNVVKPVRQPVWLLLMTPDDLSEDQNTTLTTMMTLMTTGDYLGWSMLWPIDDPKKFFDDSWLLHLAIFITKVESCLSCRWLPMSSQALIFTSLQACIQKHMQSSMPSYNYPVSMHRGSWFTDASL
jgi:hypothetical protein